MRRLSRPLTGLKSSYEIVIVGSGYGGSIAASRLSRAGKKVCLLEKGKEFLPGDFPDKLAKAAQEMQFNKGKTSLGNENGLYEFVIGDEITVFKGCGLGGTSLVNANVSIKPDPRIFEDDTWPTAIRSDMDSVHKGYDRAKEMLRPNPYPEGKNGYPVLKKTEAMRQSAAHMKEEFRLLDINVTFETKENHVGVTQPHCTNCGDCVTGCNRGAKNTTAMNYLPDAVNHGADIYTDVGVEYIEKDKDGWLIHFKPYHTGREKFDAPNMFIRAGNVILSAGSLGSTKILLRSAEKGLKLSGMLGKRFTGNGDVLGFGYNNDVPIHGIGKPSAAFNGKIEDVGPGITGVIDMRANYELEDGVTLEEGTIPGPLRSIMVSALLTFSRLIGKDTDSGFKDYLGEKWRELTSLVRGPYHGAVDHTQVYLVMANDDGDGEITLAGDNISISWKDVGKQKIFKKVNDKLKKATAALGGNFIKNPTWTKLLDYDLATVHPLGGCAMGDNAEDGVVDHKGQVFSGKKGNELHQGLYVMDGAIIPRPVGTNPLFTISALSERNVGLIAQQLGSDINYDQRKISGNGQTVTTGIRFTENLMGFVSKGENEDYDLGYEKGGQEGSDFKLTVTIRSEDVDRFIGEAGHEAPMIGTLEASPLSAAPVMVQNGTFNLLARKESNLKKLLYQAQLHTAEGKQYSLEGYRELLDDERMDAWKDVATMFVTIFDSPEPGDAIWGKGKLIMGKGDFVKQLKTLEAINATSGKAGRKAVKRFGKFFAGQVFDTYFRR